VQQDSDGRFENGEFVPDDVPEDIHVDAEVLVDQNVAKAGDLLSLHAGLQRTEFGRQLFDRFADHLEIAHDGVERLLVRRKRLLR